MIKSYEQIRKEVEEIVKNNADRVFYVHVEGGWISEDDAGDIDARRYLFSDDVDEIADAIWDIMEESRLTVMRWTLDDESYESYEPCVDASIGNERICSWVED